MANHRNRKIADCGRCGKSFERPVSAMGAPRLYCSKRCWNDTQKDLLVTLSCLQCRSTFKRSSAQHERRMRKRTKIFCSSECSRLYFKDNRHPAWRGNRRQERGKDWKEQCIIARDRDKHSCQVCGRLETKTQKLDVHHIVAFRLVRRNDLINLISVCKKCHNHATHTAEARLLRGDLVGFKDILRCANWPMDKVELALSWYGQIPTFSITDKGLVALEQANKTGR